MTKTTVYRKCIISGCNSMGYHSGVCHDHQGCYYQVITPGFTIVSVRYNVTSKEIVPICPDCGRKDE